MSAVVSCIVGGHSVHAHTMNQKLRISVGSDHAGVDLKEVIVDQLQEWGYEVDDVGTYSKSSCDYSDYANAVSRKVVDGVSDRGILICRSGIGMSIAANRWVGIRAALCRTAVPAILSRNHNNSNVLCLAAGFVNSDDVPEILESWLEAE